MELKPILDAVSTLGALGFVTIAVWAFATGRVVPSKMIEDRDEIIKYERTQKEEAIAIGKAALASHDRLAVAVEERNRLDRERLVRGD